jgi:ribonuclease T1
VLSSGRYHRGFGRWVGRLGAVVLVAVAAATAWVVEPGAEARGPGPGLSELREALPPEAVTTHRLIRAGGPFPYSKDGSVFGNRERLLPDRARGHYREYTVPTPGSRDRGARRIVCGGQQPAAPDACYYTDDHYASFRLLAQ